MIVTKEIEIPITNKLTSSYIESKLKKLNLNVLKWSISDITHSNYILTVSIIGDSCENK